MIREKLNINKLSNQPYGVKASSLLDRGRDEEAGRNPLFVGSLGENGAYGEDEWRTGEEEEALEASITEVLHQEGQD